VKLDFLKIYIDILARRIQARNFVYMKTRIYIKCVVYDVKRPEMAGILVVICEENSVF